MDKIVTETFGLLALVVGVAILAVLVSGQARTTEVISASTQGFSNILTAAVSPVTGGAASYMGRSGGFGMGSN